jgi:hypothetical protein
MISERRFRIVDRFEITGRGTVVVIDAITDLPVGKTLRAAIIRPDLSMLRAEAFKEWVLRREPTPIENEAYLLLGIEKSDVPDGSFIDIQFAE